MCVCVYRGERMLSCDGAVRANNTRSSEKHFERENRNGGRAVQARDGWMEGGSGSSGC